MGSWRVSVESAIHAIVQCHYNNYYVFIKDIRGFRQVELISKVLLQIITRLDWTRRETPERQLGFVVATSNFQILENFEKNQNFPKFQNLEKFGKISNFQRQLAL